MAVGAGAAAARSSAAAGSTLAPLALLGLLWLPWLPLRVPAAFLIWEGPLEGVVWSAAIGGCCCGDRRAAGRPPAFAPWSAPPRAPIVGRCRWPALVFAGGVD